MNKWVTHGAACLGGFILGSAAGWMANDAHRDAQAQQASAGSKTSPAGKTQPPAQ